VITEVPSGWEQPQAEVLTRAKGKSLEALRCGGLHPAPPRLARFYDEKTDYAGASFAQLPLIDPMAFTVSDVLATTLLSVRIGARAVRAILYDGPARVALLGKLAAVPDKGLSSAGAADLFAMAELYEEVKRTLSAETVRNPNAWVTASKLCARKRPGLFPVRDRVVCDYLNLSNFSNYQTDWQVFRALIGDRDIIEAIDTAANATTMAASGRQLKMDDSRLRLLDAALWTYAQALS
jgi:hypothetical protein